MDKNEAYVAEARTWIGTKWRHGQVLKGDSTDCIQWIILLGKQFGWVPNDFVPPKYSRDWALHNSHSTLKSEIAKFCYETKTMMLGDILLFRFGKTASHAGVYCGNGEMLHSHIRNGVELIKLTQYCAKTQRYMDVLESIWRPKIYG